MAKSNRGFVHVYYGNGKGKTSILNGMAIRALGANHQVCYIRFLKNRETSENKILEQLGVSINNFYYFSEKFIWEMNQEEREKFKAETQKGFNFLKDQLKKAAWDLILIDEILGTIENKFIDINELIKILKERQPHQEIVLSGRPYFNELDEISDLVSEVKEIKHYFSQKVAPRKGIEF